MADSNHDLTDELVPDSVIPHHSLPPLRYRDLPEAPHWLKLVGPSIILAGLALGSGEFVFWPYLTYRSGFVFFWACMLGVTTQFFINMEIERWTLATGESAITGFCRLSRSWAWWMLVFNILPWLWPGWATGASTVLSWMAFGAVEQQIEVPQPLVAGSQVTLPADLEETATFDATRKLLVWRGPMDDRQEALLRSAVTAPEDQPAVDALVARVHRTGGMRYSARYVPWLAIGSLLLVGVVLTSSPVVYNTVEKLQTFLVVLIIIIAVTLGILVIRPYAVVAMFEGILNIGGMPPPDSGLDIMALLGALAFAGAGGTMNLGQSNFIRDKGYGMGQYLGRITSPLTGNEEVVSGIGYHFPHTPENMRRWKAWWRAANLEHFFSFYLTCVVCLVLLSLVSYSLFYDASGQLRPGADRYGEDMNFVWGEANLIAGLFSSSALGSLFRTLFLVMGVAILFTTELGVLDATSRISADIIKVNFLRDNDRWPLSRLYFALLWLEIALGSVILLIGVVHPAFKQPLFLLKTAAAMNGGVMFLYSLLLLYMNTKILSRGLSISPLRFVALVWACAFFGYFTIIALQYEVIPYVMGGLS